MTQFPPEVASGAFWTLSNHRKIPLDAVLLTHQRGLYHYSPKKRPQLYDLATIQPFKEQYASTQLCLHMKKELPFLAIDIEPKGMTPTNPYLRLPAVYAEWSTNKGLHLLVPFFHKNKLKTGILKDTKYQTEIFAYNHFISWTGQIHPINQLEKQQAYARSQMFQTLFLKHLEELTPKHHNLTFPAADVSAIKLTIADQRFAQKVIRELPPFNPTAGPSFSEATASHIARIAGKCLRMDKTLYTSYTNRLIPIITFIVNHTIPFRSKDLQKANYTNFGYITHRQRTIENVTRYILKNQYSKEKQLK